MKLTLLQVRNLRCIEQVEVFPKDFISLIGPNNSGKSSLLRAVELLLRQETPAPDEWRRGHEAEPIRIEADFENLQDWERDKPGVSSLVYENRIRLRMTIMPASEAEGRKRPEITYESYRPQETIDGWPADDKWIGLPQDYQTAAQQIGISGQNFRSKANQERVRSVVRERFPDRVTAGTAQWTSEGVSIPAALQQALPEVQLIPAVRDAQEDGSPGAKTSFGLLLKSIIVPAVSDSGEYRRLLDAVADLERKLGGEGAEQLPAVRELAEEISRRLSSLIAARVRVSMDPPDAERFIGANTILRLDDGTTTRIPLQGHGLQRALVFALLEVLAAQRARGASAPGLPPENRAVVLLFEEPELFIHPHLMRRLKTVLMGIADRPDWQVIISTHSPFLVDVAKDPRALVIHHRLRPSQPPRVVQLQEDIFLGPERSEERQRLRALLDFHPTVCEAFFARRAVLVEGDTELAALVAQPDLYRAAGVDEDVLRDTSVVSCDGKWTIIPIARILKALGVPVRVIHDVDRRGRSDEELRAEPSSEFHANATIAELVGPESILAIDDDFEDVLWPPDERPKSRSDKPFRAWKRVRDLSVGRDNLDHASRLRDVVQFAFAPFI